MTIKELLAHQQQSHHICLIKQGLFFRAYNQGAVLLNQLLGYQIKYKQSKSCGAVLYYVGFPSSVADRVTAKVIEQGGGVVKYEDNYIEYSGFEVDYDTELKTVAVASKPKEKQKALSADSADNVSIEGMLRQYDTSNTTPLEALQFIAHLQEKLKAQPV